MHYNYVLNSSGKNSLSNCALCIIIGQGGSQGGAELCMGGYVEFHAIDFLDAREYHRALWQASKVANKHEVLDAGVELRQHSSRANRLENHANDAQSHIMFTRSNLAHFSKERSCGMQRQTLKVGFADVLDLQVDVSNITLLGKCYHVTDVVSLEQQVSEAHQGATANADAAQVAYLVAINTYQRGACSHRDNSEVIETAVEARTQTIGLELVGLARG